MRTEFWVLFVPAVILSAYASSINLYFLILFVPIFILFIIGIGDIFQTKHTIRKNYPLLGRIRYIFEALRPKIYQYFVESDVDGTPVNRLNRSIVYQRAKRVRDTVPFGTQLNVYAAGYEWISHSNSPLEYSEINQNPRILVGGEACKYPYSASILNISAMSYGALSKNAILSLNIGAKLGGFAHNTGEGGLSPYHLKPEGDLIWQIGTGYFGCRDKVTGKFDEKLFEEKSQFPSVKMIEIKISQGAKPGHGGILPAVKNTKEIAEIRCVEPGTTVVSPPKHSSFKNPTEMCHYIAKLRELSGGKPIGFKLCIGRHIEFIEICQAMIETGIYPDFITVDGGEGGTGAAPLEFTNYIGSPLVDALVFVSNTLIGFDIRDKIKIFASGKAITGFDLIRGIALGADAFYSARAMMLALGCIQALECNSNSCPTGIATHDKKLVAGLDVSDKSKRIYNFHEQTIHAYSEILGSAGIKDVRELDRTRLFKRLSETKVKSFNQIYPIPERGSFKSIQTVAEPFRNYFET
ncbi:MAG: FMN-binding glutamate synthase family protein [Halobacteriovoraceae bacterium]|nr:FMN-binding glutamate synthase family protein [Halobacteriovoraceae bacterium]